MASSPQGRLTNIPPTWAPLHVTAHAYTALSNLSSEFCHHEYRSHLMAHPSRYLWRMKSRQPARPIVAELGQ